MVKIYKIEGMDCDSCAQMLELDFEDEGIEAKCEYTTEELTVISENVNDNKVKEIVENAGYKVEE